MFKKISMTIRGFKTVFVNSKYNGWCGRDGNWHPQPLKTGQELHAVVETDTHYLVQVEVWIDKRFVDDKK